MFRKMGYMIFCMLVIVIAMAMQYNTNETKKLNEQLNEQLEKVSYAQTELAEKEQTLTDLQARLEELRAAAEKAAAEKAAAEAAAAEKEAE